MLCWSIPVRAWPTVWTTSGAPRENTSVDSVLLHQGVTGDRELLEDAIERLRPGLSTALNDGLHYVAQEMSAHRERPVIILLSDGHDTSSIHEREDVMDLLDRRPDLTVFTIGFHLPFMTTGGPPGFNSIRRFLHRLAHRTNGKFFEVPTGSRLDDVYRRINEMLNNEAVVRVVDPRPTDDAADLKISARKTGCRVQVFRARDRTEDPLARPLERPWPDPPATIDLPPDPRYLRDLTNRAYYSADPACATSDEPPGGLSNIDVESLWRADVQVDAIRGCALDVTMDVGPLFDLHAMTLPDPWFKLNAFLRTKTRPIEVLVPDLAALPESPVEVARRLADRVAGVADAEIERDSRKTPYDRHARPYHDIPTVVHGRTFFDLRERYRRRAPTASDEAIELALEQSEEGRAIRDRASNPSPLDLTRHLSAWLGDVPVIDLFERWEAERIEALLAGTTTAPDWTDFAERWEALRKLLFVSSYTRELTLLTPAHDRRGDRIGYYRVILPRPAWYHNRIRNYRNHPGWTDLPFDLVPEQPLAYRSIAWLASEFPDLTDRLQSGGYRVRAVDYDSFAKPRKQSPLKALHRARVVVDFTTDHGRLRVEFDLERDDGESSETKLIDMRMAVEGDPVMETLAAAARDRTTPRVLAHAGR